MSGKSSVFQNARSLIKLRIMMNDDRDIYCVHLVVPSTEGTGTLLFVYLFYFIFALKDMKEARDLVYR